MKLYNFRPSLQISYFKQFLDDLKSCLLRFHCKVAVFSHDLKFLSRYLPILIEIEGLEIQNIHQDSKLLAPVFYFADQFELVYGLVGQTIMHITLDFCRRPVRKETNIPLHKRSLQITVLIYTVVQGLRSQSRWEDLETGISNHG